MKYNLTELKKAGFPLRKTRTEEGVQYLQPVLIELEQECRPYLDRIEYGRTPHSRKESVIYAITGVNGPNKIESASTDLETALAKFYIKAKAAYN